MKIYILPRNTLGKWSFGLAIAFVVLMAAPWFLSQIISETIGVPFGFSFGMLSIISGIAALITGLISTFKYKERSLLVFLSILIGLFALVFIIGEFVVPH
jgi:hypothetical protein